MVSPIFKTVLFLGFLTALFVGIGFYLGGRQLGLIFFLISLALNLGSYWFSESIALAMTHAEVVTELQMPNLYDDVRSVCKFMDIPLPKIHVTPEGQANAFATGRSPKHSSICFTQGILHLLERDELKGVIAHELAHIKNRDVLISTIAAVLASGISAVANVGHVVGFSQDGERDSNKSASFLMVLIAPILALFLQMAISRQREFDADYDGAFYTKRPRDLARALEKIESSVAVTPMEINPVLSTLFIENPFQNSKILSLLSSHPSAEERIERLYLLERKLLSL